MSQKSSETLEPKLERLHTSDKKNVLLFTAAARREKVIFAHVHTHSHLGAAQCNHSFAPLASGQSRRALGALVKVITDRVFLFYCDCPDVSS